MALLSERILTRKCLLPFTGPETDGQAFRVGALPRRGTTSYIIQYPRVYIWFSVERSMAKERNLSLGPR